MGPGVNNVVVAVVVVEVVVVVATLVVVVGATVEVDDAVDVVLSLAWEAESAPEHATIRHIATMATIFQLNATAPNRFEWSPDLDGTSRTASGSVTEQ